MKKPVQRSETRTSRKWRPISTAPHGEFILVTGGKAENVTAMSWCIGKVTDESVKNTPPFAEAVYGGSYMGVTHWQPLPDPPPVALAA
jgi:hypothetical protein